MQQIYCVMWNGHNLTEEIRAELFNNAQEMFKSKNKSRKIRSNFCEGKITTEWKTLRWAGIWGYAFSATVAWNSCRTKIDYIVRETDLRADQGFWAIPAPHQSFSGDSLVN